MCRDLIRPLFSADNMSDRANALKQLIELGDPEAHAEAKAEWTKHTIGCEQYIQCIGR